MWPIYCEGLIYQNFAQKSATWISVTHFIEKIWRGVTFFGVALFGVGGGVVGGADGVRGCMSMKIWFGSFCYWGHTFLVALFCANFLWIYCLEGFAVGGSHFLMSHYIEFMSFIELANLLNSWTYGPINNNNNTNFLLTGFTNVSR